MLAKCPLAKCSLTKCLLAKRPLVKCPLAICPDTGRAIQETYVHVSAVHVYLDLQTARSAFRITLTFSISRQVYYFNKGNRCQIVMDLICLLLLL